MASLMGQLRSAIHFDKILRHINHRDRINSMRFYIDRLSAVDTVGWAFSEISLDVVIEVIINGKIIGSGRADLERPDVAPHFQFKGNSATCGFRILFANPIVSVSGSVPVTFRFVERAPDNKMLGQTQHVEPFFARDNGPPPVQGAAAARPTPFPAPIYDLLVRHWNNEFSPADFGDERTQTAAVERLRYLRSHSDNGTFDPLTRYLRYLNSCWSHFQFVGRQFPEFNLAGKPSDKDWILRANTGEEMIAIANHLYCLKSHGLEGSLAEFGCFKGYSTSMLSYACRLLDIPMVVFDSFEGLPASGSPYYNAGEFSGSLDEVKHNVAVYGDIDSVRFVKGYFSDTVIKGNLPPLICLWMDVDLEDSARDVMGALSRLDPRGALFSHECMETYFGNTIASPKGPDFVVPPIVEGFATNGEEVKGRYMCGYTGAFWRAKTGIPVVSHKVLMQLIGLS